MPHVRSQARAARWLVSLAAAVAAGAGILAPDAQAFAQPAAPAPGGSTAVDPDSSVWIGTLNAPNAWRVLDLRWPPASPTPASARLRIGDAARRLPLPVTRFEIDGPALLLEAEWAGTLLRLEGTIAGRIVEGTARVAYRDDPLTEGTWRMERYEPAGILPEEILARTRGAIGALPVEFTLGDAKAEPPADGSGTPPGAPATANTTPQTVRRFGAAGEVSVRSGGDTGLVFVDGRLWTARPPAGRLVPDTRMAEKLLLPEWVRGMEPLRHPERFVFEAWREDQDHLSLHFWTRSGGVVPVRLTVNEETWLPERAQIEWDAGPRTLTLSEYETGPAGRHPVVVVESYRGRDAAWRVVETASGAGTEPFAPPTDPWKVTFDRAADPELPGQTGAGEDGHLFVRPRVHGAERGWFHVDTGAPFVILDTRLCDELGLPVLSELGGFTLRMLDELAVGQLVLRDLLVFGRDLADASAPEGSTRAGVLGGPVFTPTVVEFDYSGRALRVYDPEAYPFERAWEPLSVERVPTVRARFAGGEGRFFLDTGKSAAVSFFSEAARARALLDGRAARETPNLTVEGESLELTVVLDWFELGGRRFERPEVQVKLPGTPNDDVTGTLGFVGRGFFSERIVVFDYERGRIAFAER
jgi:hypothetical protein